MDYGGASRSSSFASQHTRLQIAHDTRLPLITISIVRTISFTIYTSTKRILNSTPGQAAAISSTPSRKGKEKEVEAPWVDVRLGVFNGNTAKDVALTSLLAGGASGAVVCVGSAPFELVKVSPCAEDRYSEAAELMCRSGDSSSTKSIAILILRISSDHHHPPLSIHHPIPPYPIIRPGHLLPSFTILSRPQKPTSAPGQVELPPVESKVNPRRLSLQQPPRPSE